MCPTGPSGSTEAPEGDGMDAWWEGRESVADDG